MSSKSIDFPGFDAPLDLAGHLESAQIPDRIYLIDAKDFYAVDRDHMLIWTDERGQTGLELNKKLSSFSESTLLVATAVILHALDGKRKASTVLRWLNELSLFSRTVSHAMRGNLVSTITLKMFQWYCSSKQASQQKLLRSGLLYWISLGIPGLSADLKAFLLTTPPPKPRGAIEVQNAEPTERPLSMSQVHSLLANIDQLHISGQFDHQTYLVWKMMISEALRPAQMRLLQLRDVRLDADSRGKLVSVTMMIPIVKQSGTSARDYLVQHEMPPAVAHAVQGHLTYVRTIYGSDPPDTCALFCVRHARSPIPPSIVKSGVGIDSIIVASRPKITATNAALDGADLFARRFKHTKLTHLAALGAPKEVLAYAGHQTSTVSLRRYVNLSEEAFGVYETQLEETHFAIDQAFRGKVVESREATRSDPEHQVFDPSMQGVVGSCSGTPCDVLACLACYLCPRFEAFSDGPHKQVEAFLIAQQERARTAGLPAATVQRKNQILAGVRHVIQLIELKS